MIISDTTIHYPYVRRPDILVCMSQGGYDKHSGSLKEGGTLIIDQDLVQPHGLKDGDYFTILGLPLLMLLEVFREAGIMPS